MALTFGCGDDVGPMGTDSAVDAGDAGADTGFIPAPPALPAPMNATPCPDGWRERTLEAEAVACEPYATDAPSDCGPFEAHFPGTSGCVGIGAGCPAGQFPDVPAGASALYVAEGATGGDGTLAAPFGMIREAALVARSGDVIAVGKGSYTDEITLRSGVELRGACAAETVITSASAVAVAGVVNVSSADVVIRDLRIADAARSGLVVDGGSATVEGVIIEDATVAGVRVMDSGSVTITDAIVRGTRVAASDPRSGSGLVAESGATLVMERMFVDDNRARGVSAVGAGVTLSVVDSEVSRSGALGIVTENGANATIERVYGAMNAVVGIVSGGAETSVALTHVVLRGTEGMGLAAVMGGALLLSKSAIESSDQYGVLADDGGASVDLEDVAILATRADFVPQGRAIFAAIDATVTARRVLAHRSKQNAVSLSGPSVSFVAEDLTIIDTEVQPDDLTHGRGLSMEGGARAELDRVWIDRSREAAIIAISDDTFLDAEDLTITGTLPRDADDRFGRGLVVEYGADAEVRRALIADNLDAAVYVNQPNTSLLLEDAVIRDTGPELSSSVRGLGVEVIRGAAMTMRRVEILRSREVGIIVASRSSIDIQDVRILDTAPSEWDGAYGRGFNIQVDSTATGRGLTIERCGEAGLMAAGGGVVVDLSDVLIRDVTRVTCSREGRCQDGFGMGLGVYEGSRATLTDFVIERAATCGVQVDGADLDLSRGTVSSSTIGACVGSADFDLARLQNEVVYVDNDTNVDATRLPVPDIIDTPGE